MINNNQQNPCLTCGACCAYYRASFYWAESNNSPGGTIPVELTERMDLFRLVMKGTNQPSPRCIALEGQIGLSVSCSIYPARASVCREFPFSGQEGLPNERCDKARIAWGLQPIKLQGPDFPKNLPKAA